MYGLGPNSFYAQPFLYESHVTKLSAKLNDFYNLLENDELALAGAFLSKAG